MDLIAELIEKFVDDIAKIRGTFRPPPANSIGDFIPDISGINSKNINERDEYQILCQYKENTRQLDGGDSAHKTGIAAFCNSQLDKSLLQQFFNGTSFVRHPFQAEWNDPAKSSRDQLACFAAGLWRAGRKDILKSLISHFGDRGWQVNADILLPHTQMFLRYCAGEVADASRDVLGQTTLQLAIETISSNRKVEHNAMLLESIVCGRLDLYVQKHPNWRDHIYYYWRDDFRKQEAIADALVRVAELELKRYGERRVPLPLLLPMFPAETVKKIFDLLEAVKEDQWSAVKLSNLPGLFDEFAKAILTDVEDHIRTNLPVDEARRVLESWGFGADGQNFKPSPNRYRSNRFAAVILPALPVIHRVALD